ncbi:hypothetical protein HC723_16035 [Vibrio sp. S11_S32]|uniref:hypothetical protein n=1 Tax=Vibrio sp. S11_S32 TaxID=2720225 RepID=UPI001681B156|nr:hypothetical protein [Vibrio sp. S11_S32]MBD1577905.1 hypothetical protein [Vibrio sp. S11_S32]
MNLKEMKLELGKSIFPKSATHILIKSNDECATVLREDSDGLVSVWNMRCGWVETTHNVDETRADIISVGDEDSHEKDKIAEAQRSALKELERINKML